MIWCESPADAPGTNDQPILDSNLSSIFEATLFFCLLYQCSRKQPMEMCCFGTPSSCHVDCEQSPRMVMRATKAAARKSSEASESQKEAGEKAGKEGGTAFSFEPDVFR